MRKVMIPESLFRDLCLFHLGEIQDPEIESRIREALEQKLDAAAAREIYSKALANKSTPP